jgi:uncharacterized protein YcbK (DUF882 family)
MTARDPTGPDLSRRQVLAAAVALPAALATPAWAQEQPGLVAQDFWVRPRTVRLLHASGERLDTTYWANGQIDPARYAELSWFLRDRVVGRAVYMNPVLLDITYAVGGWLSWFGIHTPIVVTSGYRDPKRNQTIEGAARNSLHVSGDAMDIRIPGVSTYQLARFAAWLGGGGVGFYPGKDFTHIDRGRSRVWKG